MKRAITALSIFGLVATLTNCGPGREASWEKQSAAKQTEAAAPTAEADLEAVANEAWAARSDRAKLEQAISAWETMLKADPNNADLLTRLSRGYYFLADGHIRADGDEEAMLTTFEKGISAGERAMVASSEEFAKRVKAEEKVEEAVGSISKEGQPALYWYASNLGKFAVAKGFTTTLFYKDRIYAVMQHVLSLDETYFHAAPHRYFGAFYAKAPSFAGGDMTKSKEHFEKALALDSNYLGTKVLYAEYYAAKNEDRELFTKLLGEVSAADASVIPDLVPEQTMEQAKAKKLMAEVDDIF